MFECQLIAATLDVGDFNPTCNLQAIEQLRNTLDMDRNFALPRMVLGQGYEQKGDYKSAIAELEKAASILNNSPAVLGALGHVYGAAGMKPEAGKVLSQLTQKLGKHYLSPFYVAIVYAGLRENEKAVDWLEKAYQNRSNAVIFLKVDPELDGLRLNPRFQALLRRLALPE
jgi:tetratricopeptide (TPR) repeat protein